MAEVQINKGMAALPSIAPVFSFELLGDTNTCGDRIASEGGPTLASNLKSSKKIFEIIFMIAFFSYKPPAACSSEGMSTNSFL